VNENGAEGNVFVSTQGDKFLLMMVVGERPDLGDIIDSIEASGSSACVP
jgi:hypothetical protein